MNVDLNAKLVQFLEGALPGAAIYAGVTYPPAGYDPEADGPAVAFRVRGGNTTEERDHLVPSVQFKVYGNGPLEAWQTYQDLATALTAPAHSHVVWADIDGGLGQPLTEPETGWDFVLVFYRIHIRNEE